MTPLRKVGAALLAVTGIATFQFLAPDADASAGADRLDQGESLTAGERLVSPDGRYVLVMQSDGNLVEYAPGNRAVWASGTNRPGSVVRMQADGNLVIIAPANQPVWSTRTDGTHHATLELQNDGNVVLYATGHHARWSTGAPGSATALQERIVAVATAQTIDPARNHESGRANCNFFSGQLGQGVACGNGWRAQPWCADFARWVWGQAGARTSGLDAGAVSFSRYSTWKADPWLNGVRPGDVIGYRFGDGNTANDHVGVVVAVSAGTVTTVEGNASDRVKRMTVTRGSVSGYARPQNR